MTDPITVTLTKSMVPYILALVLPWFSFLLISLASERRKDKRPIYYGAIAGFIIIAVLYLCLPVLMVSFGG